MVCSTRVLRRLVLPGIFLASVLLGNLLLGGCAASGPAAGRGPLRAALLSSRHFHEPLDPFKDRGFDSLVLAIDDSTKDEEIDSARQAARSAGMGLYLWFEVGRNPALADRHPEWIAGMGSHEDWRDRFPQAPRPGAGQRVGVYPWTPIWYRAVLEDRRRALVERLRGRTGGISGVFLNDVQGAPSACGCGNDQCRWTADYRMPGGPEKVQEAPSALLVAQLRAELPELKWIPVWVTECEEADQGPAGTRYCGTVHCYSGLCWKESTRELAALDRELRGPLAVLLATRLFRRDLPQYMSDGRGGPDGGWGSAGAWPAEALRLLSAIPPRHGRLPIPAGRLIAVVEGHQAGPDEEKRMMDAALAAGAAGVVVARIPIEQGWEPRLVPAATGNPRPAADMDH